MQQRDERPEQREPPREDAEGVGAAKLTALAGQDVHLLHQLLVRQVGTSLSHFWRVQGQKRQTPTRETMQPKDLPLAENAVSVIDDNIGLRKVLGRRQIGDNSRHAQILLPENHSAVQQPTSTTTSPPQFHEFHKVRRA